ncbi:MAG: 6-phosphofructokinase [Chloroflexi bacterium SZAS-1]|nr:6-phosphofructokinase [Chloroflexi bacterium SZAS-1]HNP87728.1 ATP-dependent 6-phosphofructokinase [Kouleothrix sp.]
MTNTQKRRLGVLTSGGDAPGLNAVIRAVVKMGNGLGYEVLGIQQGYEGLLGDTDYRVLTGADVRGLLPRGGTILRTTNKGHFSGKHVEGAKHDPYSEALENIQKLGLNGLITIGGEGTQGIALELVRMGAPIIGVPKTIDNDLPGTDRTFGFDTALQVATDAIDRLHTTAASHNRVMVLEVMGRHAGWIALHSGIAGGADVILIPEIPFDIQLVADKIMEREKYGSNFSIIVAAEGAMPKGGTAFYMAPGRLGGVGNSVTEQLAQMTGKDCRCVVLGHLQRGGTPTPADRLLATRYGAAAVTALNDGITGEMVALRAQDIITVPIESVIGHLKTVRPHNDLIRTAHGLGVSFGD